MKGEGIKTNSTLCQRLDFLRWLLTAMVKKKLN